MLQIWDCDKIPLMVELNNGQTFSVWSINTNKEGAVSGIRSTIGSNLPLKDALEKARVVREYNESRKRSSEVTEVFVIPSNMSEVDIALFF